MGTKNTQAAAVESPAANDDFDPAGALAVPEFTLVAIEPEAQVALAEAREVLADLAEFEIETDEQAILIGETDKEAKRRYDAVETRYQSIVKPFNQAKDGILALFNPPRDSWKAVRQACKSKLAAWDQKKRAAERAKAAAAAEAFKSGAKPEEIRGLVAASAAPSVNAPGVSSRVDYVAEVGDLMALVKAVATGAAPISLLEVNNSTLQAWARATKGTATLPGVKVSERSIITTRTK